LQHIAKVAVEISSPAIERLCEGLERMPQTFGLAEVAGLTEGIAQPQVRSALAGLLGMWRQQGRNVSPCELAWALRAANSVDEFYRAGQILEMVWTGPTPNASAFRRTDQALLELILAAKHSIMVMAFAAYKVPKIAAALVSAANRGVRVVLILESTLDTFGAIEGLGDELARAATVYQWPTDKRSVDAKGNRGALHVKCAVADDQTAVISSANLTEHAMNLNMELGLMVKGGELPRALAEHLRSLIQAGVLVPINSA
jgi:phosphatidylserine/phosphatidylglycerophosphate/cardiolipin synthase-like enzyme